MIIYDVRVSLDPSIADAWLEWIRPHMLQVVKTGCFASATLERLIEAPEDRIVFHVRYRCATINDFRRYEADHAPALREDGLQRFGARMSTARALTEEIATTGTSNGV